MCCCCCCYYHYAEGLEERCPWLYTRMYDRKCEEACVVVVVVMKKAWRHSSGCDFIFMMVIERGVCCGYCYYAGGNWEERWLRLDVDDEKWQEAFVVAVVVFLYSNIRCLRRGTGRPTSRWRWRCPRPWGSAPRSSRSITTRQQREWRYIWQEQYDTPTECMVYHIVYVGVSQTQPTPTVFFCAFVFCGLNVWYIYIRPCKSYIHTPQQMFGVPFFFFLFCGCTIIVIYITLYTVFYILYVYYIRGTR